MFALSCFICGLRTDTPEMSARLPRSMSRVARLQSRRYSYTSIQLTKLSGAGNMPKPNPLAQGLNQTRRAAAALVAPPEVSGPRAGKCRSRSGRVLVGGHFAPRSRGPYASSRRKKGPRCKHYWRRASTRCLPSAASPKSPDYRLFAPYKSSSVYAYI